MRIKFLYVLMAMWMTNTVIYADHFDEEGYKAVQEGRMPEAIDLFTKSCDGGFINGCYGLAVMHLH